MRLDNMARDLSNNFALWSNVLFILSSCTFFGDEEGTVISGCLIPLC